MVSDMGQLASVWKGYKALPTSSDAGSEGRVDKNNTGTKAKDVETASTAPEPPANQSNMWKSAFNVINFMEGVGFLALPYAVHRGGLVIVLEILLVPLLLGYTASILVECLYDVDDEGQKMRVRSSYQEIGTQCWAPCGIIITILVYTDLLLTPASYIVLCGTLLTPTFPSVPLNEVHWTSIAALVVLPTVFLKSLSQVSWLSLLGIAALVGTVGVAVGYESQQAATWDVNSLLFWDSAGFLISTNIVVFSYGVHVVIIQIEGSMADQSQFTTVLSMSYSVSMIIKCPFAVLSFLTYTTATDEVILNNIPMGVVRTLMVFLFVLSVLLTYAIPVHVMIESIERSAAFKALQCIFPDLLCFVFVRVSIVALTLLLAIGIPNFALLSSFNGALTGYTLAICLPAVLHLALKSKELSMWQKIADCLLIILGISGSVFGVVFALLELIKR